GSASPCQGEGRGFESRHPLEGAVASTPAVEWPSGEGTACKRVHTGSIPVSTSKVSSAISSAGERFPDTEEVTGSIPVSRTTVLPVQMILIFGPDTHACVEIPAGRAVWGPSAVHPSGLSSVD